MRWQPPRVLREALQSYPFNWIPYLLNEMGL
jgi:hypothetical protein